MNKAWLLLVPALLVGGISCGTSKVPVLETESAVRLDDDELHLWQEAKKEQAQLNSSGSHYENSELLAYLNGVAMRLLRSRAQTNLQVRVNVIKDPHLNAFSYPNGVIYFHTGLLAALENEAQLATVLAHEIVHVTHRHLLRQFRNTKKTAAVLQTMIVLSAPAGSYGRGAVLLGSLGSMAAVSGYSREFEREADELGLELLVQAGYDPEEAAGSFTHLKRELEAEEREEPFFFGSHPRLAAREEIYKELLSRRYAGTGGMTGRERYFEAVTPLILDNVLMDISLGRFSLAQHSLQRFLRNRPREGKAYYCLGEIHRQKGNRRDLGKAEAAYRRAVEYSSDLPEPHRGLGLIFLKQGRHSDAEQEFRRYLELAPKAPDRAYIQGYLARISSRRKE